MSTLRDETPMQCPHSQAEDGTHIAYTSSGSRKRRRFLIPSNFLIQKSAKELEIHAKSLGINYEVRRDLGHEHTNCD